MESQPEEEDFVRLIMKLKKEDVANVELTAAITGYNRASCIVAAIRIYRKLVEEQRRNSTIYIEERNGTLREITVF